MPTAWRLRQATLVPCRSVIHQRSAVHQAQARSAGYRTVSVIPVAGWTAHSRFRMHRAGELNQPLPGADNRGVSAMPSISSAVQLITGLIVACGCAASVWSGTADGSTIEVGPCPAARDRRSPIFRHPKIVRCADGTALCGRGRQRTLGHAGTQAVTTLHEPSWLKAARHRSALFRLIASTPHRLDPIAANRCIVTHHSPLATVMRR